MQSKRVNCAFTEDQMKFIILKYGATQSRIAVRRAFAMKFHPKHLKEVPSLNTFERVIKRFQSTASGLPRPPPGCGELLEENVARVQDYFNQNEGTSFKKASNELELS